MADPYKTPGLAPRYQQEQNDFDLTQQVPREAMDTQYNRILRGADTGHLSQGSIRGQRQEQEAMWGLRDQANKATAFRNRASQNISDRDLQWRAQQDENQWRRGVADRQFSAQEKETAYAHERDAKQDESMDRQTQLNYALEKIRSPDELVRAEGQDDYERLMKGGQAGASAPAVSAPQSAVSAPTSKASDGYYENQGAAPAATPAMNPRMAIALKEREARLSRQSELDRQQSESANYDMQHKRFADSEAAQDKRKQTKLDLLKLALSRTSNPTQVTDILNQGAATSASLAPMVNQPSGMMGIGDAVGGALKAAYNTADQAGQAAAGKTFTTDPLEQARYNATQKRGAQQLGQEDAFQGVADAKKIVESDPGINNAVTSLNRELATKGDIGWWKRAANTLDSMLPFWNSMDVRSKIGDDKVVELGNKIDQLASQAASQYPGTSPESLRQVILSRLGETLQSDSFNTTRRQQFSDVLYGPKANRFMNSK